MKSKRTTVLLTLAVTAVFITQTEATGRLRTSTTTTLRSYIGTTTTLRSTTTTTRATTSGSVSGERTASDIRRMWDSLRPSYSGSPYTSQPSWRSPYKTGALAEGFLQDGVNMVNFVRYLARVPYDVELSDDLNELGQYGAVISAANGNISHQPSRPSGMPNDFYELAKKSCGSANLGWGYADIAQSIRSYMQDEDTGNMDRVGHRRWIINPPLRYIGFGFADKMTAAQVFDTSRSPAFNFDYVAWPASGEFPVEFFNDGDPWSVSLNPSKYQSPSINSVSITLTRLSDNKAWYLNRNDNTASESREYFNINTVGYGIPMCIIFRPDSSASYRNGSAYRVKITGLKSSSGSPVTIEYEVRFFQLN